MYYIVVYFSLLAFSVICYILSAFNFKQQNQPPESVCDGAESDHKLNARSEAVFRQLIKLLFVPVFSRLGLGLRAKIAESGFVIATAEGSLLTIEGLPDGSCVVYFNPAALKIDERGFCESDAEEVEQISRNVMNLEKLGFAHFVVSKFDHPIERSKRTYSYGKKTAKTVAADVKNAIAAMGLNLFDPKQMVQNLDNWKCYNGGIAKIG